MGRTWTEETPKDAVARPLVVDTTWPLDDALDLCGTSSLVEATCAFLDTFTFSIDDWSDCHAASELLSDDTKPESSASSPRITGEHQKRASAPPDARDSSKLALTHTKKKRNPFAWTEKKPRKQARTEILKLCGEVAELQIRLANLQATASCWPQHEAKPSAVQFDTSSHTLESLSSATKTLNEAATELQKLQRSQELNGLLRSALIEKIQVREAFEAQLQQNAMFEAYNFELLSEFLSTAVGSKDKEYRDSPGGELDKLLSDLERQRRNRITDRALKEICPPPSTTTRSSSTSAHTNSDAVYDPVVKQETKHSEAWDFQVLW